MERSRELENLTRDLYRAVSQADISFFERRLSQDAACVVIGTAPGEWWDEPAEALAAMRDQMSAAGEAVELTAGDLRAFCEGDVGWVADRPTLRVGRIDALCRHTSVFVRDGGKWLIVQHHFSIGVPNESVFGNEAQKLG